MAQSQPTFNTTQWWRFANVTVLDEFLSSPNKSSFEDQHLITDNNDNTVSSNQTHLELYFVAQRYQVVGYYVATISSSANDGYLYQQDFVVYGMLATPYHHYSCSIGTAIGLSLEFSSEFTHMYMCMVYMDTILAGLASNQPISIHTVYVWVTIGTHILHKNN